MNDRIINSLALTKYRSNDCLAVLANVVFNDGESEQVPVSVNLVHASPLLDADEFYADVNNYGGMVGDMEKKGWIRRLYKDSQSGYVLYPAYVLTEAGQAASTSC
jgi:hypothetical protein